jgi:hypothetical protein
MEYIFYKIIALILIVLIGGSIFWGLGNLIIFVFKINYEWTFLHGIVTDLIYLLIKGLTK